MLLGAGPRGCGNTLPADLLPLMITSALFAGMKSDATPNGFRGLRTGVSI